MESADMMKYSRNRAMNETSVAFPAVLVFGTGMCLAMGQIGGGTQVSFIAGIIIGIIGMVGMSVNYPIYKRILASGKKKYAFEIMELAKEISGK